MDWSKNCSKTTNKKHMKLNNHQKLTITWYFKDFCNLKKTQRCSMIFMLIVKIRMHLDVLHKASAIELKMMKTLKKP